MGNTRNLAAGLIGTAFDYYELFIFGYFSTFIGEFVLPKDAVHPVTGVITTLAVSYVARPIGSYFLGKFGDLYGRKRLLVWSLVLIAVPTFLIGLLPVTNLGNTVLATIIGLRFISGFALGGEVVGAAAYLMEHAASRQRGLFSGLYCLGASIGVLLASAVIAALDAYLTRLELVEWGWRIPFLLAGIGFAYGLYIRTRIKETPIFLELKSEKNVRRDPAAEVFRDYLPNFMKVVGISSLLFVITSVVYEYLPEQGAKQLGFSYAQGMFINAFSLIFYGGTAVLVGKISDLKGRKPVFIWSTVAILITSPFLFILAYQGTILSFVSAHVIFSILCAAYFSISAAAIVEMFPTRIRNSGICLGYNFAFLIFGGASDWINESLVRLFHSNIAPVVFLCVAALIALSTTLFMHETAFDRLDRI